MVDGGERVVELIEQGLVERAQLGLRLQVLSKCALLIKSLFVHLDGAHRDGLFESVHADRF